MTVEERTGAQGGPAGATGVPGAPGAIVAAEAAFRVGLVTNAGLAVLKLVVGWLTGSRALQADGWHSLSDILTNAGAWFAHRWSKRPPDEDHHYGHGNAEALAGALVGGFLMAAGLAVIWHGLTSDARLAEGARGLVALAVALISIGANVWLAFVTLKASRAALSQSLRALARDNASDALSSVIVVVSILGARQGYAWAEPAAAFAIGALICFMGYRSVRSGLDVLMDRVDDPAQRESIRAVARLVEGVRDVPVVRIHPLGASFRVDMEVAVDATLTVEQGHRIAHSVESAVTAAQRAVEEVQVHVNPWTPPKSDPIA